jgi:transcription antitermination protein NusB
MASRRRARGIALQALYELDCTRHTTDEVIARLIYDESVDEETYGFVDKLVRGVQDHRRQIDSVIEQHATAFPVEQMAPIDRTILRIALFEMLFSVETPVKVSINEAVVLAKTFGGEATPRLVNGVLGAVATKEHSTEGPEDKAP